MKIGAIVDYFKISFLITCSVLIGVALVGKVLNGVDAFAQMIEGGKEIKQIILPERTTQTYTVFVPGGAMAKVPQREVNIRFDPSVQAPTMYGGQHKMNLVMPSLKALVLAVHVDEAGLSEFIAELQVALNELKEKEHEKNMMQREGVLPNLPDTHP